jgi:hypothetical protein
MRCVNYLCPSVRDRDVRFVVPSRCERDAVGLLYHWDGKPVPSAFLCRECADEIIAEYREKLGEEWTLRPVDEFGKEVAE